MEHSAHDVDRDADTRARAERGYARLLGAPDDVFDRDGFVVVETAVRERPEWANWLIPVWLLAVRRTVVCSVAPKYSESARAAFAGIGAAGLLRPEAVAVGRRVIDAEGWLQQEVFYYPAAAPPAVATPHRVRSLAPGHPDGDRALRAFDGGVSAVCDPDGRVLAHAGIKDKGLLGELAVGVEEGYRRQGFGKAVVAHAVARVLAAGKVPVYVPDELTNAASYALARSLGFAKLGETLYWEEELPDWHGFPLGPTGK